MKQRGLLTTIIALALLTVPGYGEPAGGKLLRGSKVETSEDMRPPHFRCLTPEGNDRKLVDRFRRNAWSLPSVAAGQTLDTTLHCLVLRYDFQYETTDDPLSTGRGNMDVSRPLDTLTDEQYIARVGHLIDPPPHDSLYFDAHLEALNRFYETVSQNRLHLTWDVYPPGIDSTYDLPHPMSFYGRCDFTNVIEGLDSFFIDCIRLVDTVHLADPSHPDIDFSQYDAFFLFHAGSDRQNDIGFPETCHDLFTGFIRVGIPAPVEGGADTVYTALMMPETSVQDNRATALNAVIAHEFGHQLGLVDLYNTENFFTQLGDFALMDNNGFGTGLDFGWPVGQAFGTMPLFPMAWSRAFLGFVDVQDFRSDTTDIELVAAEMVDDSSLKVARVPISENEYYLLENRIVEVDGQPSALLADSVTSVIMGPVNANTREFTTEYDFLMPGSGMLIYLVDEEVAGLDYDNDGLNNFQDNDLQWYRPAEDRKFIKLIEGDGLVNFEPYYHAGVGTPDDMYREDRNHSFTPNTNPPAIDNTGNNTHIYVTNIHRDTVVNTKTPRDDLMKFDLEVDRRVDGFPVRVGRPLVGLAPIADDLDDDGQPEIIAGSGRLLSVMTAEGDNFIRTITACDSISCPLYYDSSIISFTGGLPYTEPNLYPVPLFAELPAPITAGPVTGSFAGSTERLVAAGYQFSLDADSGAVAIYTPTDEDDNARADLADTLLKTLGIPVGLSFGDSLLYVVTDFSTVYRTGRANGFDQTFLPVPPVSRTPVGFCRINDYLLVARADESVTDLLFYNDQVHTFVLDGVFPSGPITVDMDRNGQPEIAMFSASGEGVLVTIDTTNSSPSFSIMVRRQTNQPLTTNPIASDLDNDGYPELIVGGRNIIAVFERNLTLKSDFPLEVDDRFPFGDIIASPVCADLQRGGRPEIVLPNSAGNFYSFGEDPSFGFPLSSGDQRAGFSGSPAVFFNDSTGGKLGYVGGDGWFYCWEVDSDTARNSWAMGGADPGGSFAFDQSSLSPAKSNYTDLPGEQFFCYPNPVEEGSTTIRYFLGRPASSVALNVYDMSGVLIESLTGATQGGIANEIEWNCSRLSNGVYRCIIEVDFSGSKEHAFTDVAILN